MLTTLEMFIDDFNNLRDQYKSVSKDIVEFEILASQMDSMLDPNTFFYHFYDFLTHYASESHILSFYDVILIPQFELGTRDIIQKGIKVTPQDLINIVKSQADQFIQEYANRNSSSNYIDCDCDGDIWGYYRDCEQEETICAIEIKSMIIMQLQKLKPENIEALKKKRESLYFQLDGLFNKLLHEITPNSELLFTVQELDQELITIIDYRENRGDKNKKGFLWIPLDTFIQFTNSVSDINFEEKLIKIMSNISKLSFLHHSGNAVLNHGLEFSKEIPLISDLLPNVSSIILRGCGMAKEDKSKSIVKAHINKHPNQPPGDISDFMWTKGDKQEPNRQHTLDVESYECGMGAASDLTARIINEIRGSKIGVNAESLSIKFYVGPYKGDVEHGAKGEPGDNGRYLTAPKALRFFIRDKDIQSPYSEQLDTESAPNKPTLTNKGQP